MSETLIALSEQLASAVEQAGGRVVAVHGRPRTASSGVVWRTGVIVTAEHTLKRDEEIEVTLPDGSTVPAVLAGRDAGTDLAVLKIEGGPAFDEPAVVENLKPGLLALAIGRSAQSGVNASMGVLSAVSGPWRTWRGGFMEHFLRLDIGLYTGGSGGAVLDVHGRVLGVATSALLRMGALAIPVPTVKRVVNLLLTEGRIPRGFLGVGLQPVMLPAALRESAGHKSAGALIVLSVEPGGPAEKAGVVIGDILIALNSRQIAEIEDVQAALEGETIGTVVNASLVRGGKRIELPVTVGARP
jgi:S1-C subfamily serine protease